MNQHIFKKASSLQLREEANIAIGLINAKINSDAISIENQFDQTMGNWFNQWTNRTSYSVDSVSRIIWPAASLGNVKAQAALWLIYELLDSEAMRSKINQQCQEWRLINRDFASEEACKGDIFWQYYFARDLAELRIPKNALRAKFWYQQAAAQGHMDAQYRLGKECSKFFSDAERQKMFVSPEWDCLYKAAQQGHVEAMFLVANLTRQERKLGRAQNEMPISDAEIVGFYEKAAKNKNTDAMRNLVKIYYRGEFSLKPSDKERRDKVMFWLEEIANSYELWKKLGANGKRNQRERGNIDFDSHGEIIDDNVYYDMANFLDCEEIEGQPSCDSHDNIKIFKLYIQAIDAGAKPAYNRLASFLNKGTITVRDFKFIDDIGDIGRYSGTLKEGFPSFLCRNGVLPSIEEAVLALYREGAARGCAKCQYELGSAYENGFVVKKNMDKAISWYKKSVRERMDRCDDGRWRNTHDSGRNRDTESHAGSRAGLEALVRLNVRYADDLYLLSNWVTWLGGAQHLGYHNDPYWGEAKIEP